MTTLESRLEGILLAAVHAYRQELHGRREALSHIRTAGTREEVLHHAWPDDAPTVGRQDLQELEELGLIRVEVLAHSWRFSPTSEALRNVAVYEREVARGESLEPVDLSWNAVRPVLHALVDLWERNGASPNAPVKLDAVASELDRPASDLGLIRAIEILDQDDWVEVEYSSASGDVLGARPRPKALSGTRDWPSDSPHAAAERMLVALDQLIDREPDSEQKTKLSRLREFMVDVGSGTLSELATKAASGAL